MAGKRPDSSSLAEPQEALGFYLDSLLTDFPREASPAEAVTDAPTTATKSSPGEPAAATALPPETPPAADPRPFAEPERTLSLLAAPSLFPQLRLDSPDAEPAVEDTPQNSAIEIPAKAAAAPLPVAADPVVEVVPRPVPDGPPTPSAAPPPPPAAREAPAPEPRPRCAPQRGAPAWAGDGFQCLTFMVAGLTLAAPLDRLHGIVEWPGELTELPGYADWFMGLLPNRGQNVRVIDTAQIIMPDGRLPDARPVLERVKFVVLIDDGRWGLAADAIAQILTLSRDGVRWRGEGGKRPWLAGTAVEQMCAVLDIDNLSAQLAEGLKLDD